MLVVMKAQQTRADIVISAALESILAVEPVSSKAHLVVICMEPGDVQGSQRFLPSTFLKPAA